MAALVTGSDPAPFEVITRVSNLAVSETCKGGLIYDESDPATVRTCNAQLTVYRDFRRSPE